MKIALSIPEDLFESAESLRNRLGVSRSRICTVIAVVLNANLRLVEAPGNVLVSMKVSGLAKDSVANVSQVVTLDKTFLTDLAGRVPGSLLADIDSGLRFVLSL